MEVRELGLCLTEEGFPSTLDCLRKMTLFMYGVPLTVPTPIVYPASKQRHWVIVYGAHTAPV